METSFIFLRNFYFRFVRHVTVLFHLFRSTSIQMTLPVIFCIYVSLDFPLYLFVLAELALCPSLYHRRTTNVCPSSSRRRITVSSRLKTAIKTNRPALLWGEMHEAIKCLAPATDDDMVKNAQLMHEEDTINHTWLSYFFSSFWAISSWLRLKRRFKTITH